MDRARYSAIAHGNLSIWNPISAAHLEHYVAALSLPNGAAVLDIGCGPGYLLHRILSKSDATAIGVDPSPFAIAAARRHSAELVNEGRLTLLQKPFQASDYPASALDLVVCLGATHAAGGYLRTLESARRILRTGGLLLVGEGYWKQTPAAEYLAYLQMTEDDQTTIEGAAELARREGFELLKSSECTLEEWDAYEDRYAANVEAYVRKNPDDPDFRSMLERSRTWRTAYLRWGRETLGFGLFLFRLHP